MAGGLSSPSPVLATRHFIWDYRQINRRIPFAEPFNMIGPIKAQVKRGRQVRDDGEHTLMARVAAGDQTACRMLIDRYLAQIVAYGARILGDREAAQDVAQETFTRLWTHAARWEPRGAKVGTWLHRIAHNLCIDRLRKRREVLMDELPERADPANSAEKEMHNQDVSAVVAAAMAQLPDRQRAAITLCHHQELGNIEAAEVMEVTVEALESLLTRGRRKLREILQESLPDLLGEV